MKTLHQKLTHELALYEQEQGFTDDKNFTTDNLSMVMLWREIKYDYSQPWIADHQEKILSMTIREWGHFPTQKKHSFIIDSIMRGVRQATQ